MKNTVRYCKIQGSEGQKIMKIHEKNTSEGKLRPNFRLSWLVRAQVGAKKGNLTLLGGLRSTKLEFKGALGAPKEAPREPKRATVVIGGGSVGVIPCATHVPPRCKGRRHVRHS